MQEIVDFGQTASDLCRELAGVAKPNFFDDVVMAEGSSTTVECKKNGTSVLTITYNGYVTVTFPDSTQCTFDKTGGGSGNDSIYSIIATSKMICLINRKTSAGPSLIIAKDTNGDLTFTAYLNSYNITSISSASGNVSITVFKESGYTFTFPYYMSSDVSTRRAYCIPIYCGDGLFVDGVYLSLVRPYPGEANYVSIMIGSKGYVGFNSSAFITESD